MEVVPHLNYLIHDLIATEKQKEGNVEYGNGLDDLNNSAEWIDLERIVDKHPNWYSTILGELLEAASSNSQYVHTVYLDMNSGEVRGVLEMETIIIQITSWDRAIMMIVCDMNNLEMNVIRIDVSGEIEVKQATDMQHNHIIDLNHGGRRWEGDICDYQPCGYGCLYNEQDQIEYMGFMYNGFCVGYGIEYYPDLGKPKYEGTFCNSLYCGKGCGFERTNLVDWKGMWYNGKPFPKHGFILAYPFLSCTVEHLVVANGDGNRGMNHSFVLTAALARLKSIEIGSKCFRQVGQVQIIGLEQLESIGIGEKSFDRYVNKKKNESDDYEYGKLIIRDCPQLVSVNIGATSFAEYRHCVIEKVDSLISLKIEENCFCFVHLPSIYSIFIGNNTMEFIHHICLQHLPCLHTIYLGFRTFAGDDREDRKTISKPPYYFKNTACLEDLPLLKEFKGEYSTFNNIGTVTVKNIPKLSSEGIQFANPSFEHVYQIHCENALDFQHVLLINCPIDHTSTLSIPVNTQFMYSTDSQPPQPPLASFPFIETVLINAGYGNTFDSFDFSQFSQLREIHIGIDCFNQLHEFIIKDFPNLELLNLNRENFQIWTRLDNDVWNCGKEMGTCLICSCPKLKLIEIGSSVFFNYRSFQVEELPRLETLQIGHYCLPLAHQFILRKLPLLQSICLGGRVFECDALNGSNDDFPSNSFVFQNTLIMSDLHSLQHISGVDKNFENIGTIKLSDISTPEKVIWKLQGRPFFYTTHIEEKNASSFLQSIMEIQSMNKTLK